MHRPSNVEAYPGFPPCTGMREGEREEREGGRGKERGGGEGERERRGREGGREGEDVNPVTWRPTLDFLPVQVLMRDRGKRGREEEGESREGEGERGGWLGREGEVVL